MLIIVYFDILKNFCNLGMWNISRYVPGNSVDMQCILNESEDDTEAS